MNYKQHDYRLFFGFTAVMLAVAGCAPEIEKVVQIYPDKEFAAEALSVLRSRSENVVPFRANGRCILRYYGEDKKPKKENFAVKLWVNPIGSPSRDGAEVRGLTTGGVNPPAQIHLQGDVAFDPKGIVLGSNEEEFWLSMKPKEISSYWWGRWSESSCSERLMIGPKTLLEALGIAQVGGEESWSLLKKGAFDILVERDDENKIIKKLYIYRCDYLIRRIEYYDVNGKVVIDVGLDRYKEVSEGFFVPSAVIINSFVEGNGENSVGITLTLRSIKAARFTERRSNLLFSRPPPRGFKHIYKIVDGEVIEQP